MENIHQELVKSFQSFGAAFRTADVFRDFIELAAIALINQYAFDAEWEQRENRYHEIRQKYSEADFCRFSEMLGLLMLAVNKVQKQGAFDDVLGRLYMDLGLGNDSSGQYFTPYCVSKLMAALGGSGVAEKLKTEKFVSVLEPTCGSGANLIAFAEHVREAGYTSSQSMAVMGVDIDILCFQMCFIQCQLYRIPAKIVHGNSLTREFWSAWCTSDWILGGFSQAMADKIEAERERETAAAVPTETITLEEQFVLF
ncbi:N-6 DNA methylase [Neisseria dentiae]|uniref:N-6 DNA methylase n=1 Tax=Neisseria dentiae TaxID=194197 RepID=UPI0035A1AA63